MQCRYISYSYPLVMSNVKKSITPQSQSFFQNQHLRVITFFPLLVEYQCLLHSINSSLFT